MKKFFAIVTLFVLLTVSASAEIYPQTFVISDIEDNVLVLIDCNENEWIWKGTEDYAIGDIIAAIMEDNNTITIYDDAIITLRYAGYMEGWE